MKKKLVMMMAAAMTMVLAVGTTAFAAGGGFGESAQQHDREIKSNDADEDATIPVYGYVGKDTTITDPGPDEPDTKPEVSTDIHVSVPVKLIWAAFQSDSGAISSPNYYIKNHTAHMDLGVTMTSFAAKSTSDNTAIDSDLTLILKGNSPLASLGGDGKVFDAGTGVTNETIGTLESSKGNNIWNFTIGGNWSGNFSTIGADYKMPEYVMVLKFAQQP